MILGNVYGDPGYSCWSSGGLNGKSPNLHNWKGLSGSYTNTHQPIQLGTYDFID